MNATVSKSEQRPLLTLWTKPSKPKKEGKSTTDLEAKIDKMVYNLYNLTAGEIKIIGIFRSVL